MQKSAVVGHLHFLDGLRAIAACYVVAHHALLQSPSEGSSKLLSLFGTTLIYGHYAVTVFIVLSGFCLMLPVTKSGELSGGALNFFKRRALRILPPYYLAMAFSLLLIATLIGQPTNSHWDVCLPVTPQNLISHLLLLQDILLDHSAKINHVFWSISVEWRIYLLFPLMLLAWMKWGVLPTLILTLLVSYIAQYSLGYTPFNSNSYGMCLHYIGLFVIGMLACELAYSDKKQFVWFNNLPWGRIAVFLFVVSAIIVRKLYTIPFYVTDFIVALWILCALVSLSKQPATISYKILTWPPLVFIGTFAYSIYLVHAPILQVLTQYVIKPLNLSPVTSKTTEIVFGTICSVFVSYFFYLACERPFVRKRNAAPSNGMSPMRNSPVEKTA
jgi:peptidoglycan/LPS O-acetylase OafA/YrhL